MKPKVYFLPGYACTADIWRPCAAELGDQYDTLALSWPTDLTPTFHSISRFSDWLQAQIALGSGDTIVGHSLGGVVALELTREYGLAAPRIVLVESFILPPTRFFQNLLMPTASPDLFAKVNRMLDRERLRYSATLRDHLASLDLTATIDQLRGRIVAIYGDRGHSEAETVSALGWNEVVKRKIEAHVVPNACHFPMLEQPVTTARLLRSILGNALVW